MLIFMPRFLRISHARVARGLCMLALLAESESGKLYEFPAVTMVDGLPPAPSGKDLSVVPLFPDSSLRAYGFR